MFRHQTLIVCDACGLEQVLPAGSFALPPGWHPFYVPDTVGTFHACSDLCYQRLPEHLELFDLLG